jgi:hypothetical protein
VLTNTIASKKIGYQSAGNGLAAAKCRVIMQTPMRNESVRSLSPELDPPGFSRHFFRIEDQKAIAIDPEKD